MTEPIAVDVPGKPAFPRSVPMPAPVPSLSSSAAPAAKVDASKPVVTPPPVSAPGPLPPTPNPTTAVRWLARFTRKQLILGATAVLSTGVGIGGIRLVFPPQDETASLGALASSDQWATNRSATAPLTTPKPPSVQVDPSVHPISADGLLPIPDASAIPPTPTPPTPKLSSNLPTVPPTPATLPVPPSIVPEAPKPPPLATTPVVPAPPAVPPPSGLDIPAVPLPIPTVQPIGGTNPVLPATPPAVPAPPVGTPSTPPALPPLPAPPVPTGMNPTPPSTPVTPPVTPPAVPAPPVGTGNPVVPPPADVSLPMVPAPKPPDPVIPPVAPPVGTPTPPVVVPMPPAPKMDMTPTPVVPDIKPPATLPITEVKPPALDPPMTFIKPTGMTEVKPPVPEVKPNVPEVVPKTSYDVDLHNPTMGDSYDSISQEFYNDRRFAAALKAYNQNRELQGGRYVEVPPVHVLKKRFPGQTGAVVPVGAPSAPPSSTPNWSAPTDPPARATGNDRGSFTIPQGGMTVQEVAKQVGMPWSEIYDLNPQHAPSTLIPAGTVLKLPTSARR